MIVIAADKQTTTNWKKATGTLDFLLGDKTSFYYFELPVKKDRHYNINKNSTITYCGCELPGCHQGTDCGEEYCDLLYEPEEEDPFTCGCVEGECWEEV